MVRSKSVLSALPLCVAFVPGIALAAQGCDATVYWNSNFGGEAWRTQYDSAYVGDHWNDQISSFRCVSPTY